MIRKILSVVLVLTLMLSTMGTLGALAAGTSTTVQTVNQGGSLKLRSGPDNDRKVVGYVKDGDAITVIKQGDIWSKVRVEKTGQEGYLYNLYIASLKSTVDKSAANDTVKGSAVVKTQSANGSVNVRSGAANSAKSLTTVKCGETLSLLGTENGWYRVKTESGVTGYIYKTYVSRGEEAKVTAQSGLNLRAGAGAEYDILKTLPYGSTIYVLEKGDVWSRVNAGGTTGYVSSSYFEMK